MMSSHHRRFVASRYMSLSTPNDLDMKSGQVNALSNGNDQQTMPLNSRKPNESRYLSISTTDDKVYKAGMC